MIPCKNDGKKREAIFQQKLEMLLLNSDFQKDMVELDKKHHFVINGNNIKKRINYDKLHGDMILVLKKYNFPAHYLVELETYYAINGFNGPESYSLYLEDADARHFGLFWHQSYKDLDHLFLEIFPETTIKDLQKHWAVIKKEQKKLTGFSEGRIKICKNFERDKQIFELARAGKTDMEIQKIINAENIKSGNNYPVIGYSDVTKILSRFRKRMPASKNGHIRKP